jgi:hypothetical protein
MAWLGCMRSVHSILLNFVVLLTGYDKKMTSKVLWCALFVLFDNIFVCVKNHFGLLGTELSLSLRWGMTLGVGEIF